MAELYDTIGMSYRKYRRPNPRIAAAIMDALGTADTVTPIAVHTVTSLALTASHHL
jgi:hypothetical protein